MSQNTRQRPLAPLSAPLAHRTASIVVAPRLVRGGETGYTAFMSLRTPLFWSWVMLACTACAGSQAESAPAESAADVETASAEGSEPCRASSFEFAEVEAACAEGGTKAAKELMKDYVKQAKAEGQKLKCSSCHDNTKNYTLAENAVADLRALLDD